MISYKGSRKKSYFLSGRATKEGRKNRRFRGQVLYQGGGGANPLPLIFFF